MVAGNPDALLYQKELAVNAAFSTMAPAEEIMTRLLLSAVLEFVPPFAMANVPANVTAPAVALDGVSPVVPAENVVTPPPATTFKTQDAAVVPPAFTFVTIPLCPAPTVPTVPPPLAFTVTAPVELLTM